MSDSPTGRSSTKPKVQWSPPRTETGKKLRDVFAKKFDADIILMPDVDYASLERRMMEQTGNAPAHSCPGCDAGLPKRKP